MYFASKHKNHNAMCILKAAMNWSSSQKEGSFRQSIPTHLKSSIIWIFDRVVLLLSFAICVNSFLSIWTWFPILPYFGSFPLGILPILTFFYNFVPLRKKRFHLKYQSIHEMCLCLGCMKSHRRFLQIHVYAKWIIYIGIPSTI